jgi:hypothetical protein
MSEAKPLLVIKWKNALSSYQAESMRRRLSEILKDSGWMGIVLDNMDECGISVIADGMVIKGLNTEAISDWFRLQVDINSPTPSPIL